MNLRSRLRRRKAPLSAPSPPASTNNSPRRRTRRWIFILGAVTLLGVTRNQWPVLTARVQQITELPGWFEATQWPDWLRALGSEPLTRDGEEPISPVPTSSVPTREIEPPAVVPSAITPTPTPTPSPIPTPTSTPLPTPTPTPIPWAYGTRVYAAAVTEYTFLWMEPGTAAAHLIAERYESGTAFEIIEPGRGYDSYPVVIDGVEWWRIQAQDGLVGWVSGEQLTTDQLLRG